MTVSDLEYSVINGILSNLRCFCSPIPQMFDFRTQFLMLLLLYIDARFWIEFCVMFFGIKKYCGILLNVGGKWEGIVKTLLF